MISWSALHRLTRLTAAWANYANPAQVLRQRLPFHHGLVELGDRRTGVRCRCPKAAASMFGDVWHNHCYEAPGIDIRPGDAVLDIGANYGFFATYAAQRGAKVWAFEPTPSTYRLLMNNLAANGFLSSVKAEEAAIGAVDGTVTLYCSEELGGGMNTIVEQFRNENAANYQNAVGVRSFRLESALRQFSIPCCRLLKLDCEGSELEIVKQLDGGLYERFDAIVLEYHAEAYPVTALLDIVMRWTGYSVSLIDTHWRMTDSIVRVVSNDALRRRFAMSPAGHSHTEKVALA